MVYHLEMNMNKEKLIKTAFGGSTSPTQAYAIIRNIPGTYHAKHLRHFFSDYVESERFQCFHYRHRPEIHILDDAKNEPTTSQKCKRFCCVVSMKCDDDRAAFIEQYHLKLWTDEEGREIPSKCFIFPLELHKLSKTDYGLLPNMNFNSLIELKPPDLMPCGNVGTSTKYFFEQIRLCKLPPKVLSKLGIKAKRRIGKYGAVYLSYSENKAALNAKGLEPCAVKELSVGNHGRKLIGSESEDEYDQCEEWERYEALHDDVTEQERTKPSKYEEEQEVTWEKGGPGLVWYTDTFFWNEMEEGKDVDWKWADDWDVDYFSYYDRKDGDVDGKQAMEMLEDRKLRMGEISQSVFKKKENKKRDFGHIDGSLSSAGFGDFEAYTKGIGSKIMKRYGWSPGKGLGPYCSGRLDTISVELEEVGGAQISGERKGLGYKGEKLQRTGFSKTVNHTIMTKFDK